jgi:nucleoid-associated protein YgaU
MKGNRVIVMVLSSIVILACFAAYLASRILSREVVTPTPLPQLIISATPSNTPEPPTQTVSPTATDSPTITPSPPPDGGTAEPDTLTAVPPTLTPTLTPEPTATKRPSTHTVEANEHLWGISLATWGVPDWQCLYDRNQAIIKRPDYIFPGQVLELGEPCD